MSNTDSNGNNDDVNYDDSGNYIGPSVTTWTSDYTGDTYVISDQGSTVTEVNKSNGTVTTTQYNSNGNVTSSSEYTNTAVTLAGVSWHTDYDSTYGDNLRHIEDPDQGWNFYFDEFGNLRDWMGRNFGMPTKGAASKALQWLIKKCPDFFDIYSPLNILVIPRDQLDRVLYPGLT